MNGEIKYQSLRTTAGFHLLLPEHGFTHKSTEAAPWLGTEDKSHQQGKDTPEPR